ncbi:MAG: hypothetical protein HYV03_06635 [Deltaproteobacteria bacterium]|nr:hypothetical protein [Deltaproteobacteria bacterium]
MQFRLMLDRDQVDRCRKMAREIATQLEKYAGRHTSVAIERAALRAMGVHGESRGQPLTEAVVEQIGKERLRDGAGYWLGYAMWKGKCDAQAAAQHIAKSGLPTEIPRGLPHGEIRRIARSAAEPYFARVLARQGKLDNADMRRRGGPRAIVVVKTGHLKRDIEAVKGLAKAGVDGMLVRPPIAADKEHLTAKFGGWRGHQYDLLEAVHKTGAAAGRALFIWGGNHLLMPEVLIDAAAESLHAVEYDCLTLTRLGKVHFKRAIVDQRFIFRFLPRAGIALQVASDRWLDLVDGYSRGHELPMGIMLIEAMGEEAGLQPEQISPCGGLVIRESRAERLALELAHAQLTRELFPHAALGFYCPAEETSPESLPLAVAIANVTEASYCVLAGPGSRSVAIEAAMGAVHRLRAIGALFNDTADDIAFSNNGKVIRRTHTVLNELTKALQMLHHRDFLKLTAEEREGLFAVPDGGAGIEGVLQKGKYYWHPVEEWAAK